MVANNEYVDEVLGIFPDYANAWMRVLYVGGCWRETSNALKRRTEVSKTSRPARLFDEWTKQEIEYSNLRGLIRNWDELCANPKVQLYQEYFGDMPDVVSASDPTVVQLINSWVEVWNAQAEVLLREERCDLIGVYTDAIDNLLRGSRTKAVARR